MFWALKCLFWWDIGDGGRVEGEERWGGLLRIVNSFTNHPVKSKLQPYGDWKWSLNRRKSDGIYCGCRLIAMQEHEKLEWCVLEAHPSHVTSPLEWAALLWRHWDALSGCWSPAATTLRPVTDNFQREFYSFLLFLTLSLFSSLAFHHVLCAGCFSHLVSNFVNTSNSVWKAEACPCSLAR